MRKVMSVTNINNNKKAIVKRCKEYDEFIVEFHINGIKIVDADYHTGSKIDAIMTANHWINEN